MRHRYGHNVSTTLLKFASVMLFLMGLAFGQGVLDQINDPPFTGAAAAISPGNHVSQSFVPSLPCLTAIELGLKTGNPGRGSDEVTLRVSDSGGKISVSVWQSVGPVAGPQVGAINPTVGQPGMAVTVTGQGFGGTMGSVVLGTTPAMVQSWSDSAVSFVVPNVGNGVQSVQLKNDSGVLANPIKFTVLAGKLIPVTFTVNNATPTKMGDCIFLTGDTVQLGNWGTTFDTAIGLMPTTNYPNGFRNVSLPAGRTVEFKFIKIAADGTVTWEDAKHQYTVPDSGTGSVNVNWQAETSRRSLWYVLETQFSSLWHVLKMQLSDGAGSATPRPSCC